MHCSCVLYSLPSEAGDHYQSHITDEEAETQMSITLYLNQNT